MIRIGVTQIISHPALDNAAKGFEMALSDAGFKEGENIVYDRQNAQGEMANAQAIAQKFYEQSPYVLNLKIRSTEFKIRYSFLMSC